MTARAAWITSKRCPVLLYFLLTVASRTRDEAGVSMPKLGVSRATVGGPTRWKELAGSARSSMMGQSAIVAMAVTCEFAKRLHHRLHFGDLRLEFGDMGMGHLFHISAGPLPITPK